MDCGKSPEDVPMKLLFQIVDERHLQKCICNECLSKRVMKSVGFKPEE